MRSPIAKSGRGNCLSRWRWKSSRKRTRDRWCHVMRRRPDTFRPSAFYRWLEVRKAGLCRSLRLLLLDLALDVERALREFSILRLGEEGIEPAAMIDAAQRIGGHAQAHRAAERVRQERHVQQV